MKAYLFALVSLLSLFSCGPKGPSSLEVNDLQVTEGDKDNLIIRFKTAPEAYVIISLPVNEKSSKQMEKIIEVKADGIAQAEFLLGTIPNEVTELDLRITHHQLSGVETKKKIPLNTKPKLVLSGNLRTNPLQISCRGRAFSLQEESIYGEGFFMKVNAPSGTKIEFGKSSFTSTGDSSDKMTIELTEYLIGMKMKDLEGSTPKAELKIPIKVSFPDGAVVTEEVVLPGQRAAKSVIPVLSAISKGPVMIPGEPPAAGDRSMVYLEGASSSTLTHYGADETFGELDLIAIKTNLPERLKPCGEYKGAGKTGSFGVSFFDTNIKVYDRRSGKLLKEKTFTAPAMACPSSIDAKASGASMTSSVKFELMRDFMKSAL
jgi:hypothetical protein